MKNLKLFIAVVLLGLMASCGYSVKSDRDIKQYDYRVESLEIQFEEAQQIMRAERDSIRRELVIKEIEVQRYKDSIAYMELSKVQCYESKEHRHSCIEYK